MARVTLDGHETELAKADIRSPIDGLVLQRQIEPGQTVAASLQAPVLFTLAEDLAQMELHVAVDEADVGKNRGSGGGIHRGRVSGAQFPGLHHPGALCTADR